MAFRYLTDIAEARALQPVPCTEAVDAILTQSVNDAEDLIDGYLKKHGATVPITGTDITDLLKIATALMVAYDLYKGYGQAKLAEEYESNAKAKLDEFLDTVDLDIAEVTSSPGVFNYQEEHISDWNEPNETAENMDE